MAQQELFGQESRVGAPAPAPSGGGEKRWMPRRVLFTPAALAEPFGQAVHIRLAALGLPIEVQKTDRLTGLRGSSERETYKLAKSTLGVVKAPPSALRLQPIPPSADWQFHLAEGCPAHCQYCYLAGSLSGPPVVRAFANLPAILQATTGYEAPGVETTFEASCYTDPLSLEHLTGTLSAAIAHFGTREHARLRFVTKFSAVEPLLGLAHNGHTRARISLNAEPITRRLEGGTATLARRIAALRRLALPQGAGGGGYPVGVVLAPIMPIPNWEAEYSEMLVQVRAALDFPADLTFECITHRFTPGSKEVLQAWYPGTTLDMEEATRSVKRNKFGGTKYVFTKETMRALRQFLDSELRRLFPEARTLYWT